MDADGYPEEYELKIIREWKSTWIELMYYVKELWQYQEYFVTVDIQPYKFKVSTGGWSGNEDLINELVNNVPFWITCWYSTTRGGHYIFIIPDTQV